MTDEATVVQIVKAIGPASVGRVARLSGIPRDRVYGAMYRLRRKNLIVRKAHATYDVTRRGLRVTSTASQPELFADAGRACRRILAAAKGAL